MAGASDTKPTLLHGTPYVFVPPQPTKDDQGKLKQGIGSMTPKEEEELAEGQWGAGVLPSSPRLSLQ